MFKKIILGTFLAVCFMPSLVLASNPTVDAITKKCSFLAKETRILSDAQMGSLLKKENQCYKMELTKLIDLKVKDPTHKAEIKKNLATSEQSTFAFLFGIANYNITCATKNNTFDCGTMNRYLVPDSQLQKYLIMYIEYLAKLKL